MKNINKIIAATLISTGLLGASFTAQAESRGNSAKEVAAMSEAKINMTRAVEIALEKVPGTVIEAEFEVEKGKSIWEVDVVNADKKVYEVEIDATSGEVIKQELNDDGDRKHRKNRMNKKHDGKKQHGERHGQKHGKKHGDKQNCKVQKDHKQQGQKQMSKKQGFEKSRA